MKRYSLIAALLLAATVSQAQNVWEKPSDNKETKKVETVKEKENAEPEIKDAEYLAGAVPEVDGRVVWNKGYDFPGKTAQQIYDATYTALQDLTSQDDQLEGSGIALLNKKEHIIVAIPREWLTFKSKFLWLDRTKMIYTLTAKCSDGHLDLSMGRIKFIYKEDGNNEKTYLAEESINDKNALNKKKTKLVVGWAKFRRKTVDRRDEIFQYISDSVKGKLK